LGIAQDFGAQQGGVPRAITIHHEVLNLEAGPPLQVLPSQTPPPPCPPPHKTKGRC
jgi:hypothetical protein